MTANELIKELSKLSESQKDLPIRLLTPKDDEYLENIWLFKLEISEKGNSGYEQEGEIRLIGAE
jgi:hypothetical protein